MNEPVQIKYAWKTVSRKRKIVVSFKDIFTIVRTTEQVNIYIDYVRTVREVFKFGKCISKTISTLALPASTLLPPSYKLNRNTFYRIIGKL